MSGSIPALAPAADTRSVVERANALMRRENIREPVDIRRYGVKGDGTTDDTDRFQAALTDCAGKVLQLQAGANYLITSTLTNSAHQTQIHGQGASITYTGTGFAFDCGTVGGTYCVDLVLDTIFFYLTQPNTKAIKATASHSMFRHVEIGLRSGASNAVGFYLAGDASGSGPYYNAFLKCVVQGQDPLRTQTGLQMVVSGGHGPNSNVWLGGRLGQCGTGAIIAGCGNLIEGVAFEGQPAATITAITRANPGQVTTSAAHGFTTGAQIYISDVQGMTAVNDTTFTITVMDSTHFTLGVDTSGYAAYTSAGTAQFDVTAVKFDGAISCVAKSLYLEAVRRAVRFESGANYNFVEHVYRTGVTTLFSDAGTGNYWLTAEQAMRLPVGVEFSASQSVFKNYKTGTWTPTLVGGTSTGDYSLSTGGAAYTRVGNVVHVQMAATVSIGGGGAGTGDLIFGGLPFNKAGTYSLSGSVTATNLTIPAAVQSISIAQTTGSASSLFTLVGTRSATSPYVFQCSDIAAGSVITIACTYITDDA